MFLTSLVKDYFFNNLLGYRQKRASYRFIRTGYTFNSLIYYLEPGVNYRGRRLQGAAGIYYRDDLTPGRKAFYGSNIFLQLRAGFYHKQIDKILKGGIHIAKIIGRALFKSAPDSCQQPRQDCGGLPS